LFETAFGELLQKELGLPSSGMEVGGVEREEWKKESSDVVLQS
jgi:hypothetical protein